MRVVDVMSKPVATCRPDDPLSAAAQQMWDQDCGVLVVVGDDKQLVGMITDRDICMATWSRGAQPDAIQVADVMASRVVSCAPIDTVERALRLMGQHQVRRLPVVDPPKNQVVGLLSLNNLIRYVAAVERSGFDAELIQALARVSQRPTSEGPETALDSERARFGPTQTLMH